MRRGGVGVLMSFFKLEVATKIFSMVDASTLLSRLEGRMPLPGWLAVVVLCSICSFASLLRLSHFLLLA